MDRPLRLIPTEVTPAAELARTLEALLVVASQPLSIAELEAATELDAEQVHDGLEVLAERFAEGRSGIVLEHVAAGSPSALRSRRPKPALACSRSRSRRASRKRRSRHSRSSPTSGR